MGSLYNEALDAPEQEEPVREEDLENDTYGLIYNGHLTDTVKIGHHEVRIRTLKIGEELEAALLAHKWKDSVEESRANITSTVAACIVSVDGSPVIPEPLGPHDETIEAKFDYLRENWYWATIYQVFLVYNELVKRVMESLNETGKG